MESSNGSPLQITEVGTSSIDEVLLFRWEAQHFGVGKVTDVPEVASDAVPCSVHHGVHEGAEICRSNAEAQATITGKLLVRQRMWRECTAIVTAQSGP
ncbi:MAG: hypothetical protein QM784_17795 [Polyangiaceae bacterium]